MRRFDSWGSELVFLFLLLHETPQFIATILERSVVQQTLNQKVQTTL